MDLFVRLSGCIAFAIAGFGLMYGGLTEAQALGLALVSLPSLFAGGRD